MSPHDDKLSETLSKWPDSTELCIITDHDLGDVEPIDLTVGGLTVFLARTHAYEELNQRQTFQTRVAHVHAKLFDDDPTDIEERRNRFLEEALETAQAFDMTEDEAHALVAYTFSRPKGEPMKEIGGALVTLTSLCIEADINLVACGEMDLAKFGSEASIGRIKAKRKTRHGRGALPGLDPYAVQRVAIDPRTGRPIGDHGTCAQAIEWAVWRNTDTLQTHEFLKAWQEGNAEEWPEFYEWLKKEEEKAHEPK